MQAIAAVDRDNPRSVEAAVRAADALGEKKPPGAVDVLGALAERPADKRLLTAEVAAIRALGKLPGNPSAVASLIRIVARPAQETADAADRGSAMAAEAGGLFFATRGAAVNALGDLRAPDAVKPLVVAMYETPELMMQIRRALVAIGPAAKQEIERTLRGENDEVKAVLAKQKNPAPVSARDFYGAVVLGDFRDPKDQPLLLELLKQPPLPSYYLDDAPSPVTQYNAVFDALRKIGGADSAATVRAKWQNARGKRGDDLKTAILAIGTYPFVSRDGADYEELGKIAADNSADDELRQEAATAFARLAHDDKSIALMLDLAKKYLDASAKKDKEAAPKKAAADAADAAFAPHRAALEQAKQRALAVARDPSASVADIKAATAAAKKAEDDFKTAKKKHREQTAQYKALKNAANAYFGYARMFQVHVARIEIAERCKSDIACYAAALKATPDDAVAFVRKYLPEAAEFTGDDKRELVAAAVDRAMCELGKQGTAASGYTGALLDAAGNDHKLIREAVLLALPKIAAVPCAECETKLAAAAHGDDRVETEILRNYFHWAGGR